MNINQETVDRAQDLLSQIVDNMEELKRIFRGVGGITFERFKAYPYGNVVMALSNDHDILGKCPCPINELINDLQEEVDNQESDEDDSE